MNKNSFYITTPIYYPSGKLHIGHSYTTVAADAMARYKRMQGFDVMFLTGTDEHGQKIQRVAAENGVTPKQYVDDIVGGIKSLWSLMQITHDKFIRTTDREHIEAVQKIFKTLYDKGDIYKSEYEGKYCTPCESFWTETQLKDGMCPDCGRPVENAREESYFFRLSKYQDRLIALFEGDNDFIQPASRRNEMLNNFLRPGLEDLCVSRTSFRWGIPVSFDDKHVVYVWIDALSNYVTALGYLSENDERFQKYWPADVHLVGKEIVRFHTIIWPAMLMALDLPLPKQVYGHGWLVLEGGKMSKSKGNVVDPVVLVDKYGLDAIRYFLLREVPFGADGVFSNEALIQRINSDLANDLGNLVSRTVAMIQKYFDGKVPDTRTAADPDSELIGLVSGTKAKVEALLDKLQFSTALTDIWKAVSRANKYIDETMPWALAKDEAKKDRLAAVLYNLAETLRIVAVLIEPFMPLTPVKIRTQLGVAESGSTWESAGVYGLYDGAAGVVPGEVIFPRIDMKKELELLGVSATEPASEATKASAKAAEKAVGGGSAGAAAVLPSDGSAGNKVAEADGANTVSLSQIGIEDFAKVQLRVVKVLSCEKVEKSDKLLKLQLDDGEGVRQVVSGIAQHYAPDAVVGKTLVLVANLKPARLRGIESNGMILAAHDKAKGTLTLVTVEGEAAPGTTVS